MLHIPPTNLFLLAAKQEPYKKASLLTKNTEEFSGKQSFKKNGSAGRKKIGQKEFQDQVEKQERRQQSGIR